MRAREYGLTSVGWAHGWAAYQQAGHEESACTDDSSRLASSFRGARRWLALDVGVLPSETICCRLVSAMRLSVRSLRIHDAHLDTLGQARVGVPELWTVRRD